MEKQIFTNACTKLKTASAAAYIAAAGLAPIKTLDWWQEQIEDALKDEGNEAPAFDMPALFFEFSETKYEASTARYQEANGQLMLHIAQDRIGKDGRDGEISQAQFLKLLDYVPALVDILTDGKLPCTAQLVRTAVKRDHSNNPVLHETITFTWSGRAKHVSVP